MSRLRNRIRKADYFTDGELLRWPRDKRTTYSGLWALAEDSGCLEDDPFAWKMSLWPSPLDADITIEVLKQWRDELVEAGKLIPYEAEGKALLYIKTFHQHEHPRNPQRPNLPLPEWVACGSLQGVGKDGKHWVRTQYTDTNHHDDPLYRHSTDSVPTPAIGPPPRPAPSRVPKGTTGTGRGDKSPSPPVPASQEPTCWRCHETITGDEVLDDQCVISRRGTRHRDCDREVPA